MLKENILNLSFNLYLARASVELPGGRFAIRQSERGRERQRIERERMRLSRGKGRKGKLA